MHFPLVSKGNRRPQVPSACIRCIDHAGRGDDAPNRVASFKMKDTSAAWSATGTWKLSCHCGCRVCLMILVRALHSAIQFGILHPIRARG